ncbi:hypothetical protein CBE01nite_31430 [Clostridium beijerinckii]|uniref:DUF5105 domain-containing protein n=1 Tax=Clostridium beijerinckii TaxID=1520 RepID=A0AB74VJ61_CLOBE|nr:hypothetical protein [Clostridium beijerinckii]NRZ25645.1 hypothetical protein [Clostridium beijerinckii]NYB98160.1 hypothetical protein [Clostridium beijerinckii]OOM25601.1 hypothetical protein CLBEI_14620 [Clostridium beijerinckii]QUN36389.1 hypothetical protein KEC93_06115 [Clostridium beijerinckii]SQB12894.1 Uncharacterised protein [Clostridium beijerinckii]
MKMKKLLSMGALGLVVACSTSIGALAADTQTTSKTDLLIKMIATQYLEGTNPTGLFEGVKADTPINTVVTDKFIGNVKDTFGDSEVANKAIKKFENNKDATVKEILQKATSSQENFERFRDDFIEIAKKVQAMDKLTDDTARAAAEKKVISIVSAYNSSLTVAFGKDAEGRTSATIKKSGKTIIQLNSEDLQKVIDKAKDFTWNDFNNKKSEIKNPSQK